VAIRTCPTVELAFTENVEEVTDENKTLAVVPTACPMETVTAPLLLFTVTPVPAITDRTGRRVQPAVPVTSVADRTYPTVVPVPRVKELNVGVVVQPGTPVALVAKTLLTTVVNPVTTFDELAYSNWFTDTELGNAAEESTIAPDVLEAINT
jgi:hypothetical protein